VGSSADPIADARPVPEEYRNITLTRRRPESEVAQPSAERRSKSGWWGKRKGEDAAAPASRVASANVGDAARWSASQSRPSSRRGGASAKSASGEKGLPPRNPNVDPALREHMREWRRNTAREQGLPAFVVLHDSSLDELCRVSPRTLEELRGVTGFGERKTELYGRQILDALARFSSGAQAATAG
jgi:superfamily II DNA helicase RecQ